MPHKFIRSKTTHLVEPPESKSPSRLRFSNDLFEASFASKFKYLKRHPFANNAFLLWNQIILNLTELLLAEMKLPEVVASLLNSIDLDLSAFSSHVKGILNLNEPSSHTIHAIILEP